MIDWESFEWEVLDRNIHNVQDFSSGYAVFDQHLQIDAIIQQASGLSQTRVYTDGNQVIAYYTSKCSKIEIDQQEMKEIGAKDNTVPAIEIPMLAVHKDFQRRGVV